MTLNQPAHAPEHVVVMAVLLPSNAPIPGK